jgi:taurine--2-oxoglutarate transaminase
MPGYATTSRATLSQKLLELLPEGLEKFFFTTSGTEANEAAFKIARMYTGKTKIISRYRSYHGSTMASIAPPATRAAGRWSRAAKARALSLRRKPTVTSAPSSTLIPAATSPAPITSST